MNHLAHTLLAGDDEELQLGGMLGDFVHGQPDQTLYSPRVIAGIRLHRAIDVYTDAHLDVLAAKALLPVPYRRYAGILLDMWFDHCLAREFSRWSGRSLLPYSDALRALLWRRDALLTPALRRFRSYMDGHGLPACYADRAVLGQALAGIGQRLSRANPLDSALPVLVEHELELQRCFEVFFPELRAFARQWIEARGG
ncbi:ACP phosphodiesterase [Rhodanobacter sp. AS-Z3]|uniref:acyl carrier protein phosphodiesterase n=1 Tax=Rhodanobacter sp. AS-Z3 TaxID=3031330 RepID=UPI00247A7F1A|nr:ACP phosphodiesterase [Rhodanobacter sp. AS-Z3]WEN15322.1 ACP phosphodiesterase [Rhodanobacter sp. AS-Z3]